VIVTLAAAAASARSAGADQSQVSMLQDDPLMLSNPEGTLLRARQLGVSVVRLMLRWQAVAPTADSFLAPENFQASDPAAYSAAKWAPYDAAIRDAQADGITIDLDVVGGAPLWATGPGMPDTTNCPCHTWDPSASDLGAFMRAVATRYSGNWNPSSRKLSPGNRGDLPRVSFWSVWNEPDYGPGLAPQVLPGHPGVEDAPQIYRGLVDAAWSALRATGHGSDTILIGELAPRGSYTFGDFNGETPLVFVRALYCLGSNYRPLRGAAAALRGCPTTAAGTARFASRNPGLFHASGFSDHPYMRWYPPDSEEDVMQPAHFAQLLPDYTTLATIGNLERALDRAMTAYGSSRKFPIWNTEFGYQTDPPKRPNPRDESPWVSQAIGAYYDNWAEYISWKDPRIMSFDQYLLEDPLPALSSNNYGGYASGLLDFGGAQKPGYGAFRMPLYMPHTTAQAGMPLEVWGAVKPVHFTQLDIPHDSETVQILFTPAGLSTGVAQPQVVDSVPVTSPEGYFDTQVIFPASGTVQLAWTYPQDPLLGASGYTVYSRKVQVKVNSS
jgi:hypothetical protein